MKFIKPAMLFSQFLMSLMISEVELESRRQEWINRQIDEETNKYNDRVEFLKQIKYKI